MSSKLLLNSTTNNIKVRLLHAFSLRGRRAPSTAIQGARARRVEQPRHVFRRRLTKAFTTPLQPSSGDFCDASLYTDVLVAS
ncbi:hypothetical protein EVAR_82438_1 [Eumeta japonica]|uniref:Uncharacterized protein n=1 Tax=Eumeta variegata TaxID=151549 RepID=A0A4C1YIW4_EUMVA|nr:hypothetical protein EVAR_82438_1 [Eumeta japonica]